MGGGELTGQVWRETLRTFHTRGGTTEPRHQNQNFAERNVQIVKEMSHRVMDQTGPPTRLWCFVVDYVMDVWNHLANQNNSWRTPIEKLTGHTPDISKFRLFSFYNPIKYLDSDVKFPKSKVLTGNS